MCGFIVLKGKDAPQKMDHVIDVLQHRGPDDRGIYTDERHRVSLGHRRLSIIDPAGGAQPMKRENTVIVYNGEIYNYVELREELKQRGRTFTTDSDTEVILESYREWGKRCLEKFRGMFAFCIWDEDASELFLARDRLGQKPLFYSREEGTFAAASEIQGLTAFDHLSGEPDTSALSFFLQLNYIPSPKSGFRDVRKVRPGECITVGRDHVSKDTYWSLNFDRKKRPSYEAARKRVRKKLTEAVKYRLRSDVPLGAFLSGGIDSSIVVSLMSRLSSDPVKTFSIGFDYEAYNELEYARTVAEAYSTEHHEFRVTADIKSLLPRMVSHFGEPFSDYAALPTYYLSKHTSEDVKVVLTGDGGDEAFGGYTRYDGMYMHQMVQSILPDVVRSGVSDLADYLPRSGSSDQFWNRLSRFCSGMDGDNAERNYSVISTFQPEPLSRLLQDDVRPDPGAPLQYLRDLFSTHHRPRSLPEETMAVDYHSYLPERLLMKVDITTMMTSLEARSPFMDHELVEYAASLPAGYKYQWGKKKRLLRDAFRDDLPEAIWNHRKRGFPVPVSAWFRNELRTFIRELLLDPHDEFDQLFCRKEIRRLLDRHQEGDRDYGRHLWNLMMIRLWMEQFDVVMP